MATEGKVVGPVPTTESRSTIPADLGLNAPIEVIPGEHIFPATRLTKLAMTWKELNATERHRDAMLVLEQIIKDSTPMFERLAQHEDYHLVVDLKILTAAAQEKVVRWLLHWKPAKGRLFTWFSKCAKNAFRSEVVKVNQYRKRFHVTDENPERLFGFHDPTIDKHSAAENVHQRLNGITARWGSPQELGAIRYIIACLEDIQDGAHDKQGIIKGASFAYGINLELAKFFYTWSLVALRDAMYDQITIPFTEQDLFQHAHSYTLLPDLLNTVMTWAQLKKFIAIYGGQRLKVPTLTQLQKLKENYEMFEEMSRSDMDPDSVTKVAKKYGRSEKTAEEVFREMTDTLNPNRAGEYPLHEGIPDE
jgi:hypothetical protein